MRLTHPDVLLLNFILKLCSSWKLENETCYFKLSHKLLSILIMIFKIGSVKSKINVIARMNLKNIENGLKMIFIFNLGTFL